MTDRMVWVAIAMVMNISAWILFLVFGQLTVRKLRKNPNTKDALGFEFMSGWDIFNAAQALALPQFLANKLNKNGISFLYAKKELLTDNTTKFDQFLAMIFYWLFVISGVFLILIVVLNSFGFFDP